MRCLGLPLFFGVATLVAFSHNPVMQQSSSLVITQFMLMCLGTSLMSFIPRSEVTPIVATMAVHVDQWAQQIWPSSQEPVPHAPTALSSQPRSEQSNRPKPQNIPGESGGAMAWDNNRPFTESYVVTETPEISTTKSTDNVPSSPQGWQQFYPLELSWANLWASQTPPTDPLASSTPQETASIVPEQTTPVKLPAELVVDLSDRTLFFYKGKTLIKQYPVAIGQAGWETPTGVFQVTDKHLNPVWQHPLTGKVVPPGPDNPLGVAWIGFWLSDRYQIGFHGTSEDSEMGEAISHGCVRMRNADIAELYDQVDEGSTVTVRP